MHRVVAAIGGGPTGLAAAIAAASAGARTIVCEHMPEPGRKLLATGDGRCNLANSAPASAIMAHFGRLAGAAAGMGVTAGKRK